MNVTEIMQEFDLLYNNISSGAAPNLNGYEQSVFLTRAQEELVRMYYSGSGQRFMSFESDEETRRYLDTLVESSTIDLSGPSSYGQFHDYAVPKNNDGRDVMFVLRETASNGSEGCANGSVMQVVPVRHEDLNRVLENPFKRPNERKALRYDLSRSGVEFHILSSVPLSSYTMTYLRKPEPVIVEDLTDYGMTIDNQKAVSAGSVPDMLMHKVIARACELAKAAYNGDLGTSFAVNARDL